MTIFWQETAIIIFVKYVQNVIPYIYLNFIHIL